MRLSIISLALAALPLISAHPTATLQKRALSANDTAVLQLALYLEHLEFSLYSGGYQNFTEAQYEAEGFPNGFRDNVEVIASQEATHAATISSVLTANGVTPVAPCLYKFPYTDPKSFVALANMITTVGIGAYLGGADLLQDNPTLLTTAASILTNEARHDSYLRAGLTASPFPNPFDTSLTAVFAYNLAQAFIVSCPTQLPIIILPTLTLTAPMPPPNLMPPVAAGATLSFSWDPTQFFVPVAAGTQLYIALINEITNIAFLPVTSTGTGTGNVIVPTGVAGVAFAVLTTFSTGLTEDQLTAFGALTAPAEVALS
ncbi:MAG: hypothetical protein M1827_004397 [Pycnora praestabilis]|nr:MAG: hypothetical protein M1827_004397 [Pycnora praestabilis]